MSLGGEPRARWHILMDDEAKPCSAHRTAQPLWLVPNQFALRAIGQATATGEERRIRDPDQSRHCA